MARTVTLLDRDISKHKHICVFYNSTEELYGLVPAYMKEGYDQREQLLTIMDDDEYDRYIGRLADSGIPIDLARSLQQLKAFKTSEAYLAQTFDPKSMLAMVEETLQMAQKLDFSSVRTCGAMNWAAEPGINTDHVMLYESSVNSMVQQYDCTCLCVYDARRFSGTIVMDILATHPVVIINGQLSENPYYIPPPEFLQWMKIRSLWSERV